MSHDTGSLSPGDRLDKLESLHESGGACDEKRCEMWKAITALRIKVNALETKLLIGGTVIGICGPLLAQWLFRMLTTKP